MIQHAVSIYLNRPAEAVFAYLANIDNLPKWQSDLVQVDQLSAGPLRAGSVVREVRRQGQRQDESQAKVELYEPNTHLRLRTITQPLVTIDYSLEATGEGTQLKHEFVMVTSGFMRILEPLIAGAIKKQTEEDFERLKRILEGRAVDAFGQGAPMAR